MQNAGVPTPQAGGPRLRKEGAGQASCGTVRYFLRCSFSCVVCVMPAAAVNVGSLSELQNNLSDASVNLITITDDIPIGSGAFLPVITREVTITSNSNKKIYRTGANPGYGGMFTIGVGGQLILNGSVVLDGNNGQITGNTQPLVYVSKDGIFNLTGYAVLKNNTADNGGGVYVYINGRFSMSKTATVDANNEVYLYGTITFDVTETITGGALNITPATVTIGRDVVKVSGGETAKNVKRLFQLNPSISSFQGLILKANKENNLLEIAKSPTADTSTVTITPYNSTVANVSFNLTNDMGADYVYVNLMPAGGTPISTRTQSIAAGGSVNNYQVSGLIAGTTYTLEITPVNGGTRGTPDTLSYTAPKPYITFKYADGTEITDDPLTIANGASINIYANITNNDAAGDVLYNEIVSWALGGTNFTTSGEKKVHPYNITIAGKPAGGTGNITVTVSGVSKKLELRSDPGLLLSR